MPPVVTFTVRNDNPKTIANKLAARLGRAPTHEELKEEVKRILNDGLVEAAGRGKLPHQRSK